MHLKPPKDPRFRLQGQSNSWMVGVEGTHKILQEYIIEAQEKQTNYASRNVMMFAVGVRVWLLSRNLKTSRPSKRFAYKCTKLYMVTKSINQKTYKLDLLSTMRNNNIFHMWLLDSSTPPVKCQPSSQSYTHIIKKTENWEVDCILHSGWDYRNLHYVIQWPSYNPIGTSWELVEHLHYPMRSSWQSSPRPSWSATAMEVPSLWLEVYRIQKQFGCFTCMCVSSFSSLLFGLDLDLV